MRLLLVLGVLFLVPALAYSAAILVPQDYKTIQKAIDAAAANDVILVAPGTYVEHLSINGKSIILRSDVDGIEATHDIAPSITIIDGGHITSVISL
ncbi:MAG: DUF1565 domain-containing protein, partial [Planctomycetota bacterium]